MTIWYAHSPVTRSNEFLLLDNAFTLTSGTVSPTSFFNRNNRDTYSNAGFAVAAGEVISLGITKSAGQGVGSLDGMTLDFTFTADASVPEPATVTYSALCFAGIALAARKRRRKA